MRGIVSALVIVSTAASPGGAKSLCPPDTLGPNYPWQTTDIMSGDWYADVYLDIDKKGRAINCKMGKNNIPGDDKFWVCKAFIDQWSTAAPLRNATTGSTPPRSPVAGTEYRKFIAIGSKHMEAQKRARAQFFQQHPDLRSDCYPD